MRGFLLIAKSAESFQDGTFSVDRGCIYALTAPGFPSAFSVAVVARIEADFHEAGDHKLEIAILDEDLANLIGPFGQTLRTAARSPHFQTIVTTIRLTLARRYALLFRMSVDGAVLYEAPLVVHDGKEAP